MQYGSNPTDTVTGVIIYPDDFSFADAGVGAMRFGTYQHTIDIDTWEALEEMGCIFLPSGSSMTFNTSKHEWAMWETDDGRVANYHTATAHTRSERHTTVFFTNNYGFLYLGDRSPSDKKQRAFVRLVQDL